MPRLPRQRWCIAPPQPDRVLELTTTSAYPPAIAQVLINRQIYTNESARQFFEIDPPVLPDPLTEFPDLGSCVDLLEKAIRQHQQISICGDYDVDGMTSTAVLIRTIRAVGGRVNYAIPSRMTEGYGINQRIVRELHQQGTALIITVDNGIMAKEPIALARSLGMAVIVTDHHELPEDPADLPPAHGILNPKYKLDPQSHYSSIAGVGMAYVLALTLSDRFQQRQALEEVLLELFTLGTIADLAPLTGINRHLVKRGLKCLANSQLVGVRALIATTQKQGGTDPPVEIVPDTIGFQLGPRINAIGRIGDPRVVIELLTTDDPAIAQRCAEICHQTNIRRQELCNQIEREAIQYIEAMSAEGKLQLGRDRVLVLVDGEVQAFLGIEAPTGWHHGVIGIVASRLVERYGAPVFIGSVEDPASADPLVRFSVRGIPEFHVFQSLEYIRDLRTAGGGHKAAGGFTMPCRHLPELRRRLQQFAEQQGITPDQIQPFIEVDAKLDLHDINLSLWKQVEKLQPCGIGNPVPVFYSENVPVYSQMQKGKEKQYLALELVINEQERIKAIAWKWGEYCPVPNYVDIAYHLRANEWQGNTTIELELVGIRYPTWHPVLECPLPPRITALPRFAGLYEVPRPLTRPLLLYGYNAPKDKFQGDVDYDRPKHQYHTLVLWTLPPSPIHLQWLIALAKPQLVLIGKAVPPLPTPSHLLDRVHELFGKTVLNLLEIGQQWWVSPAVIIAALRELGYECASYSATQSLATELTNLAEWYHSSIDQIAESLTHDPGEF
ncbi:MAG: single-stranded-DNA-specific exonuclease RecJ [Pseudanabaenaceae cyanobacterium]